MQLFLASISNNTFELDPSEVQHAVKVLRKDVGDAIQFITGDGNLYEGTLETVSKKRALGTYRLVETEFGHVPYQLTIAIAPTKRMDRMELFVEKATEMGISEIIPIICHHSERKHVKVERLQKVALSAAKQSLKGVIPTVHEAKPFKELLKHTASIKCIAHCEDGDKKSWSSELRSGKHHLWLIGPEGDFSPAEVESAVAAGFSPVHLGSSRLRTETAGLAAVAMAYAALGL